MDVPRQGIAGLWDRVVGPGASPAENVGTVLVALLAGLLAPWLLPADASGLQQAMAMLLAADVVAGIWVCATPAGRRWYQGRTRPQWSRIGFVVAHGHPFVVVAVFGGSWVWASALYGHAVLMTAVLAALPARLRTSTCLVSIAVFVGLESPLFGPAPLPWFGGAYLLKLLAAYGLPEIPGRSSEDP